MGIYFRDILLRRISRGTSNCVQHVFEKNIYVTFIYIALLTIQIVSKHLTVSNWRIENLFHNEISPHFKFLLSNERLDFCEFLNADFLFLQPYLIIFTKGTNNSDHVCVRIKKVNGQTFP